MITSHGTPNPESYLNEKCSKLNTVEENIQVLEIQVVEVIQTETQKEEKNA